MRKVGLVGSQQIETSCTSFPARCFVIKVGSSRLPAAISTPKSGQYTCMAPGASTQHFAGRGRGGTGAVPKRLPNRSSRGAVNSNSHHHQYSNSHHQNGRGRDATGFQQRTFNKRFLDFSSLKKLTDDFTDPSEIVRKFTEDEYGLDKLLRDHPSNMELTELVLVALGKFCKKNGNASFPKAFIKIVQILTEAGVFHKISSVIFEIASSTVTNLGTRENRLGQFVSGISFLATEMLVQTPTLACNALGKHFFGRLSILKEDPSIRELNQTTNVFDSFKDADNLLQNTWEKNASTRVFTEASLKKRFNRDDEEILQMLAKPPNDFRTLSIMPTPEDMYSNEDPFLRPNLTKGSYPDVDTYLDVQFRLLREDFFRPVRNALQEYRGLRESNKRVVRLDNVKLYQDVRILDPDERCDENTFTIEFSTRGTNRINWEGSKRLIFGSLLLLSPDDFKTFLVFTVVDRKPDQLRNGRFKAKFEGGSQSPTPHTRKRAMVMAESSAYFEAYRSVLLALQKISPNHFAMQSYILGQSVVPAVPNYLLKMVKPIIYDLTVVRSSEIDADAPIRGDPLTQVAILQEDTRPDSNALGLDPSQTRALYAALTRELVVIQGPPGTGKTYLGLKIVRTLLHNKQKWSPTSSQSSPILVICYTNHALDQFLEGIMKYTDSIVRIGGQSKSEAMENFALRKWKMKAKLERTRPANLMHWQRDARTKLRDLQGQLNEVQFMLHFVKCKGIVHEDSLLKLNVIERNVYDKLRAMSSLASAKMGKYLDGSVLPYWLGLWGPSRLLDDAYSKLEEIRPIVELQKPKVGTQSDEDEMFEPDDQWDKEDIDEIQGQREMEDEDDLFDRNDDEVKKDKAAETSMKSKDLLIAFHIQEKEDYCVKLLHNMDGLQGKSKKQMNGKVVQVRKSIAFISALLGTQWSNESEGLALGSENFDQLPLHLRWKEYLSWRTKVIEVLEERIGHLEVAIRSQANEVREVETVETAEIIRSAAVVGITTSGAAKQKPMLEHLKCKIVVVEEAAEVLEAHIITSLSSSCEHLILIGDHFQLRPSTAVFELSRRYHLDVSLFERLILNGMEPCILGVQHRMRPEVARLIVPAIYPTLENHKSVERYKNIPGMVKNVFFLSHSEPEIGDKSDQESRSHLNPYEADLALALTRYLLAQGVDPGRITILTAYSGQLLHLRKIRRNHSVLEGVRISVIDNFQGEENDVIILSLVRSNEDANIGFLRTTNRVCVALSRAKMGFYVIGNIENLQRCELWRKISEILESNGEQGTHFELQCSVHPTTITQANQLIDFPPEGGCFAKCETPMHCGHVCPLICHVGDREHVNQKCLEACLRSCSVGHPCPKTCFMNCDPCQTIVEKILPCTHSVPLECGTDPKGVSCPVKVVKILTCKHHMELPCGSDIMKAKCPEKCEITMDCGHDCKMGCRHKIAHDQISCLQPCRRTCPEKHPCPKVCFEKCGGCQVKVLKLLPCGHQKLIKCSESPKEAYCDEEIEKVLDCRHTVTADCSGKMEGFKCKQLCQRMLCVGGHLCRKPCWVACGPCRVQVQRELDCGHPANMECHKDPMQIKCKVPKEVILMDCNHRAQAACGDKQAEVVCPVSCDLRLDCGHQCTLKCHVKDDPDHVDYRCDKMCERNKANCKSDHKCNKKCHEECDRCNVQESRTLPCGHTEFTECGIDNKNIFCGKMIVKTIPDCGHQIKVACFINPTRQLCKKQCEKQLLCGHPCTKQCLVQCSPKECQVLVPTETKGICGHPIVKTCCKINYPSAEMKLEVEKVNSLKICNESCSSLLACTHSCKGQCGTCFNGRLHKACKEKCNRTLICGHSCKVNCASSCPPCQERCQFRCQHSRCNKKCCEPCQNCVEPCGWRCKHHKCTRKCYESCNRPRCNEPCDKKLPCGHNCVGLCGEKCPPLCRTCNKEELTEFVLYGNEGELDARFVFLEDCGHSIEVEGLDHWMEMQHENQNNIEIQMKCCPRCKTLIRSCYRYGDIIKRNFADVVRVKNLLIDSPKNTKTLIEKLTPKISNLIQHNSSLKPGLNRHSLSQLLGNHLVIMCKRLKPITVGKKTKQPSFLHADERYRMEVQVDIIERLLEVVKHAPRSTYDPDPKKDQTHSKQQIESCVSPFSRPASVQTSTSFTMKPDLLVDILDLAERIVLSLLERQRISPEEYKSFVVEVYRLDLIRAFFMLRSARYYDTASTEERQLTELLLLNKNKLDPEVVAQVKKILAGLAEKLRTGLGISDHEREAIVRAMGLSKGHWYKCPKGHIYAIGDCGGATQESRCPDCGSGIGGYSHQLRSDNSLAPEMDGARFPAWPQTANDMRNYNFM